MYQTSAFMLATEVPAGGYFCGWAAGVVIALTVIVLLHKKR